MNEEQNTTNSIIQSRWKGNVVSVSGERSIVVEVMQYKTHPKYLKKYRLSRRFLVHDPSGDHKEGDVVEFVASKPVSKRKRFIVVENNKE